MSRHLVLDCDPGCDDALALLLALSSDVYSSVDILTVAGNVGVDQTTQNARRLNAFTRWHGLTNTDETQVRLFKGSRTSLRGEIASAASVHGRDGMGDVPLEILFAPGELEPHLKRHPQEEEGGLVTHLRGQFLKLYPEPQQDADAVDHLRSFASTEGKDAQLDLVCTGPLTNLARALLGMPLDSQRKFWRRWTRVVFMGGAIRTAGNISYAAEFNLHADPDAFAVVLASLRSSGVEDSTLPILVPLDITEKVAFWAPTSLQKPLDFEELGDVSKAVLCLLRKYFLFHAVSYPPPLSGEVLLGDRRRPRDEDWLDRNQADALNESLQDEFTKSRQRGKGGLKILPLWCYLHDPSALWIAMDQENFPEELFEVIHLQVDATASGSGRGHLFPSMPRRSFFTKGALDQRGDLSPIRLPMSAKVVEKLRANLIPAVRGLLL